MSVLLLSGGFDSAVCLALRKPDAALFVDYGQPHRGAEFPRAAELADAHGIELRRAEVRLPNWTFDPQDRTMLIPGRNLVLVSLAATLGSPVVMGCNADDYEVYADCRPEFFDSLGVASVETPLIQKTKAEIGQMARDLGIAPEATWSCYYPVRRRDALVPCGECDACTEREWALG
jgi:7-cyano-7-deazaguanine synthase